MSMMLMLTTAMGGGLGAVARFHLGIWLKGRLSQDRLPNAMLIVNLLGSFGLGVMMGVLFEGAVADDTVTAVYTVLGTGFFGAFTTFSTFSVETVQLIRKKASGSAAVYVALTILGSFAAFLTGVFLIV